MATLKQRLHRKNASGTYDTIHFESASDVILRPSGRTVEQDLADYLPEVQDSDNVPQSLSKLIIGLTKGFIRGKALSVEGHTHSQYAASSHTHDDRYYTESETNNLLSGKAATLHTHDDRYYTESETNSLLAGKAASSHTHTMDQLSGILPVEKGGTGVTSLDVLKNALGIGDIVGIESGTYTGTLYNSNYTTNKTITFSNITPRIFMIFTTDDQKVLQFGNSNPSSSKFLSNYFIAINGVTELSVGDGNNVSLTWNQSSIKLTLPSSMCWSQQKYTWYGIGIVV